ncbi:hypothetical protein LTR10_018966 [Elasticomyces elasticus]|uniref:Dynein light chain n=1 Tax=Exophiala sideris TaxID=1016849 RepID=A0ABR0IXW1_9EURO|nr:hypothetical protein LTR10_018966 [Elasticomyces elasticus]KAK5022280.1 hypothetical protein LTS07_010156 [Exophiala sideris]KAK5027092.1 hypothetical protein LTR13_009702 [Exophiala sideris]KAK5051667.1 hypothetical protein LTR69_010167 [Exophiala sideris]KAK5177632.1 hypothetical protein LTR44_009822 [Eurotiomycetes sp. CCFEE 6388]
MAESAPEKKVKLERCMTIGIDNAKSEDMQQEAIEVGTEMLSSRHTSDHNIDPALAQEAMEKFTVEKVRSVKEYFAPRC